MDKETIEDYAKELHEAARKAVELRMTVGQSMRPEKSFDFIEWDDLSERAREGLRLQAKHMLREFGADTALPRFRQA